VKDGVRFCVDRVVLDQNDAGQLACAAQVLFDYRLTDSGLLCAEAKNAGRIMPDYESNPGVAQIADTVEQNQRRSNRDHHRACPHTNSTRLKLRPPSPRMEGTSSVPYQTLLEAAEKIKILRHNQQKERYGDREPYDSSTTPRRQKLLVSRELMR
jgi:hypothetical protein